MSLTLNPPDPSQASTAQANTAQANPAQAPPAAEESFELVYRAIWQDNRTSLTESVRSEFMDWSEGLRARLGGGVGQTHSKTLAGADASSIEVSLETTCDLGTTRTIMRVLSEADFSWIWIDAESTVEHDRQDQALTETIQLVGSLVAGSRQAEGQPHVGEVLLSRDATAINPYKPEEIENLAKERIFSPERKTPIVIFAHDPIDGPKATMERAGDAAQRLAGIAQVLVLPNVAIVPFQKMMGAELDVQPGEARVYMPYSSQTITHHPVLTAHQIRSNFNETSRRLLLMLKPTLVASEPPRAFDALQKTTETRKERDDSDSSLEERIELLEDELEEVWDILIKSRQERNNIQSHLKIERSKTERLESELQSSIEDALDKQVEINSLQDKLVMLLSNATGELPATAGAINNKDQTDATVVPEVEFTSMQDVLSHVNAHLKYVVIHPEAGQELYKFDRSYRRDLWIRELMTGLKALGAYAHNAVEGGYSYKNFQDWCIRSDHSLVWPGSVKKLSMYESEEVKRRPELKKHRQMQVSTEVDPSGIMEMEAHLKLSNGDVAPRLYFYDDTKGETRMVHVGYFGPHLPSKRFPGN